MDFFLALKESRKKANRVCCKYHPEAYQIEDHESGSMVCSACGLVLIDQLVDESPEWRDFRTDENKPTRSRVGAANNPLFQDGGLGTYTIPANGQAISLNSTFMRNYRSLNDTKLLKLTMEMKKLATMMHISTGTIPAAQQLAKKIIESPKEIGYSCEAKAAAILYITCRQEGNPRSFREFVAASPANKRDISRCFTAIKMHLEGDLKTIFAEDFMGRFCGYLAVPHAVVKCATHVAHTCKNMSLLGGRSPISIAAAAIYMASHACGIHKTKKEVADVAGVLEKTLKESYMTILPYSALLLPKEFATPVYICKLPIY